MNENNKSRLAGRLISIIFILTLTATGIFIFLFPKNISEVENRVLQTLPKPDYDSIISGDWQKKFESFASDQFPMRDKLFSFGTTIQYAFGFRELSGVLVGETENGNFRLFESFKPDTERITRISGLMNQIRALAALGVLTETKIIVVPAPTASLVYPEDMPPHTSPLDEQSALDAFVSTGAPFVLDISDAMRNAKTAFGESLYFRLDHHWTDEGAYLCYKEIAAALGLEPVDKPDLMLKVPFYGSLHSKAPISGSVPDDFTLFNKSGNNIKVGVSAGIGGIDTLAEISLYSDDALNGKDKYAYYLGGNYGLTVIENDSLTDSSPTLFIFKDSFANSVVPYLTAHFHRIIMVDPRYYRGGRAELLSLLSSEQPNVMLFLYELTELSDGTSLQKLL